MLDIKKLTNQYNNRTRSYCDIIPWFRQLTDGVVLNTDGSLLAGFEVHAVDLESSDEAMLDAAINAVEAAFNPLDDHCTIWSFVDKRRKQYTGDSSIVNPVARAVDAAWREQVDGGNLRTLRHVFFIAYQPFQGAMGFFDEVSSRVSGDVNVFKAMASVAGDRLSRRTQIERLDGKILSTLSLFEEQVTRAINTLSTRMGVQRLCGNPFITELANRANVATSRTQVSLPNSDFFTLNATLPIDTLRREHAGLISFEGPARKAWCRMLSVKGYPGLARNPDVEQLLLCPADFTLVQMYRFLDHEKAKKMIGDLEQHYRTNVKTPVVQIFEKLSGVTSDRVNLGQAILADDAQAALAEATAENITYGYHSMAIQILGDTPEDVLASEEIITGQMTAVGYGLVRETINVMSAFAMTLPGASAAVTRSQLVNTRNLADITPVRTISSGANINKHLSRQTGKRQEALTIMPTVSDIPEMFNLHVEDVGHFLIIGGAGNGKTTFVNFLIMMWQRYYPCRVIALDKDYSNLITIQSLGGTYVDIRRGGSNNVMMAPARWARNPENWPKLRQWLEMAMLAFDDTPFTPNDVKIIDSAIRMASQHDGDLSLTLIYHFIAGQSKVLAGRLHPWTKQSDRYGDLFDNSVDQFQLSTITGIEMGGLLADEHLAPALLTYLFGVIEESVDSTQPTLIYLEEAWYLLRNPFFREMFEDWIKTMRKRNCSVGLATQSVKDLEKTPISSTLNDNIRTRIYLPNIYARASQEIYCDMLGLRLDEVDILRDARPKLQYYVVQDTRRRLIELPLRNDILPLTQSDARAKDLFARNRGSGAPYPDFVFQYLKEMNHA